MYKNLKAEMARLGITQQNIADCLQVRNATISDKINGKSRFYYDEALKIKTSFFPALSLEYLFDTDGISAIKDERINEYLYTN